MKKITIRCNTVLKGIAEGEALVTRQPICLYDSLDPKSGLIINKRHELYGAYFSISVFTLTMIFANLRWISSGVNFISFISLSTLFMKRIGLTLSRRACIRTVSVWVMGPSTASTTTSAPSTARRLLLLRR